jgi:peptide/nickel transport system ATP-binding protein
VRYTGENQVVDAVRNLSFELSAGETLGIVGESGSGKTQAALSLMGLLPETATVSGKAFFDGIDLLAASERELNQIRGNRIAMIFQDPMTALNPHLTIGRQMTRVLQHHQQLPQSAALARAADMLDSVRIPSAKSRLQQYPHEMSGGMRQRVMIATALLCKPRILIADEPTTALDVTVQAQILNLLKELQQEMQTAILLITHDMGVVASTCDRVLVMRDGEKREAGDLNAIFYQPRDSYTQDLLAAVPRLDGPIATGAPGKDILLEVDSLSVSFDVGRETLFGPKRELKAVDDVSLHLNRGETLGVVGEYPASMDELVFSASRLTLSTGFNSNRCAARCSSSFRTRSPR